MLSRDHEESEAAYVCRICFEDCDELEHSGLISPCSCKGSQKYVHAKCLRAWQSSVLSMRRRVGDDRAHRCSVCRQKFTSPPPHSGHARLGLNGCLDFADVCCRVFIPPTCCLLLSLTVAEKPWAYLLLLLLMNLCPGARSMRAASLLYLLGTATLLGLYSRGLRVVMQDKWPPFALIRYGLPVEGLNQGMLLVASSSIDRGIFRRSVVFLYEHSSRGARGVMLTHPLDALPDPSTAEDVFGPGIPHHPAVHEFLGGPVGRPEAGKSAQHQAVLHNVQDVPNSRALVAQMTVSTATEAGRKNRENDEVVFVGGSLTEVLKTLQGASTARDGAGIPFPKLGPKVHVYHGICAWAEGQLEGELRSGAWGFGFADPKAVLRIAPEQLWQQLTGDPGRLRWLT